MPKPNWPAAVLGLVALAGPLAAQPAATDPARRRGPGEPVRVAFADRPESTTSPSTSPSGTPPVITEVGGRSFDEWKADLKHRDPSFRSKAMLNIILFGERAADAIPLIIDRLHDNDASCRAKGVLALKLMSMTEKHVGKVVIALAERLTDDPQGIVRYEAAQALLRFAGTDDIHLALNALLSYQRGITDTATWEIRQISIQVLRRAGFVKGGGPDPRATRALILALKDTVEQVRLEATISLGAMGPPADPMLLSAVVHALDGQLAFADKAIALWSHVSLLSISDTVPEKSLKAILKVLEDPKLDVRLEVLHALQAIGPKAKDAVPTVMRCLEDKEPAVIAAACITLARLGDTREKIRAAVIKITERSDEKDRALVWYACQALAEMGKSEDILEALKAVSQRKDLDKSMRDAVAKVLEQVKKGKVGEIANPKPALPERK
jgi:HEAT repeat protein